MVIVCLFVLLLPVAVGADLIVIKNGRLLTGFMGSSGYQGGPLGGHGVCGCGWGTSINSRAMHFLGASDPRSTSHLECLSLRKSLKA